MPYDPQLAERLQQVITNEFTESKSMTENRMMGGFGYMLNGNICVGIYKDTLIIRVGQEIAEKLIQKPHIKVMDFTGKVMKAWATVEPEAMKTNDQLKQFCQLAINFVDQLPAKNK